MTDKALLRAVRQMKTGKATRVQSIDWSRHGFVTHGGGVVATITAIRRAGRRPK
jgi:hypothetical protein